MQNTNNTNPHYSSILDCLTDDQKKMQIPESRNELSEAAKVFGWVKDEKNEK